MDRRAPLARGDYLPYAAFVAACVVLGGIAAVVGAAAWAWPWVRKQVGVVAGVALAVELWLSSCGC